MHEVHTATSGAKDVYVEDALSVPERLEHGWEVPGPPPPRATTPDERDRRTFAWDGAD
jgi:hypothetical protein